MPRMNTANLDEALGYAARIATGGPKTFEVVVWELAGEDQTCVAVFHPDTIGVKVVFGSGRFLV